MEIFVLLLGLAVFIIVGVTQLNSIKESKDKLSQVLDILKEQNFNPTQLYKDYNHGLIALDSIKGQIAVFDVRKPDFLNLFINFQDILSCEILEDGDTVLKKSKGSSLGRAIVGGVLLGGIGAIAGAASTKSKGKTTIKLLELKIVIRNLENPSYLFPFFQLPELQSSYPSARKEAEKWKDLISIIIDNNENN